jgi:hypothetical protein
MPRVADASSALGVFIRIQCDKGESRSRMSAMNSMACSPLMFAVPSVPSSESVNYLLNPLDPDSAR